MAKNRNKRTGLSKSQFLRGMQCHKSLYLFKYKPELLGEISASQLAVFENGKKVGTLAQSLFPGGVEIPYEGLSIPEQIAMTRKEINAGTKTIYEASFEHDGVFVKVDILHKGARGWELYEAKSSTKVKEVNIQDVALQYYVLNESELRVNKVFLVTINSNYLRQGEIDLRQLFAFQNLTKEVRRIQKDLVENLCSLRLMLQKDKVPVKDIGPHCSDPYPCDFCEHCWSHIPEPSVFSLTGKGVDKFALYSEGIVKMKEIPLDRLNLKQRHQVEAFLGKHIEFNTGEIEKFLKKLWYPLCFLDFESFMDAIPPFDDTRPYHQIPFQYSLHTVKRKNGKLYHTHFLAEPNKDPRKALVEQLLKDIPEDACLLTFNKTFEISVLKGLAELYPRKQKRLQALIDNVRDLMEPFRNRSAYHWQMQGSYSIKKILPAFVPELSYDSLKISDGGMAMEAWHSMCAAQSPEDLDVLRRGLLAYCEMDTLAMVRLLEVLQKSVELRRK
jgi:hypothetical protein